MLELLLRLTPRANLNRGSSKAMPGLALSAPLCSDGRIGIFDIEMREGGVALDIVEESNALPTFVLVFTFLFVFKYVVKLSER